MSETVVCLNGTEDAFVVDRRLLTSAVCAGVSILLVFQEDVAKNTGVTPSVVYLGGGFVADVIGNELVT